MVSVIEPAKALIDPLGGVTAAVQARRWFLPLVALAMATSLSGAAFALRWDPGPGVLRELGPEASRTSEREIAEKIEQAGRVRLVAGVAKGVFVMPLSVLLVAVALKLCGWLFGTRARFAACFSAAAIAFLPIALYHLVFATAALRQVAVTESQLATLVPSSLAAMKAAVSPEWKRALGAVDFFSLWSATLLGLGFSAASGMRRSRAVALGFLLYVMYAAVFLVGVPGLMASGGGGPPR
ncbi:MAG: YIP1 family protein [Myxococcota bacterium]